jgi:hypothetical protein
MDIYNFYLIISSVLFTTSLAYILYAKNKAKKEEIKAQFVVTGCLLVAFYCVCFLSGVCTILNFLWRWVL